MEAVSITFCQTSWHLQKIDNKLSPERKSDPNNWNTCGSCSRVKPFEVSSVSQNSHNYVPLRRESTFSKNIGSVHNIFFRLPGTCRRQEISYHQIVNLTQISGAPADLLVELNHLNICQISQNYVPLRSGRTFFKNIHSDFVDF